MGLNFKFGFWNFVNIFSRNTHHYCNYLRKTISYFGAWLWKNSLCKWGHLIWNFIKFLLKSIKITNFSFFISRKSPLLFQKSKSLALCVINFFGTFFFRSIHYKLLGKSIFIFLVVVETYKIPKFLVFSLNLSTIPPLSFQKSTLLRLCVVKFFQTFFKKAYIINYLRKIISYFLDAWLWKNLWRLRKETFVSYVGFRHQGF